MSLGEVVRDLKRPWEDSTVHKLRTGKGQIAYIVVPSQDGSMNPITENWEAGVEVYREDQVGFSISKGEYKDRTVEIPADCHNKNGDIDWSKVGLLRDSNNPLMFSVILEGNSD